MRRSRAFTAAGDSSLMELEPLPGATAADDDEMTIRAKCLPG